MRGGLLGGTFAFVGFTTPSVVILILFARAVMDGWAGGLLATFAIFLPAFLLVLGTLPFWVSINRHPKITGALMGVNAAVVGILISVFYTPIWTSSILTPIDFAFAALLFSMLTYWKLPPWVIVITGIIGGYLLSLIV
jgi:chromate transporter